MTDWDIYIEFISTNEYAEFYKQDGMSNDNNMLITCRNGSFV